MGEKKTNKAAEENICQFTGTYRDMKGVIEERGL